MGKGLDSSGCSSLEDFVEQPEEEDNEDFDVVFEEERDEEDQEGDAYHFL